MIESKNSSTVKNNLLDKLACAYLQNPNDNRLTDVIINSGKLINYFIHMYGCGHSRDDLYQEGVEGVLKALKRYDPDSGASFSTFAGHCIMGGIRHYARKETSYYRPAILEKLQNSIEDIIIKELDETGGTPEISDIAEKVNICEEGLREVMKTGLVPIDAIDISRITSKHLESFRLPIEDRLVLHQAFNKLSDMQRKVIYMLFYRDMTQEQTAAKLNINQRKVSRLLHSSLNLMRGQL